MELLEVEKAGSKTSRDMCITYFIYVILQAILKILIQHENEKSRYEVTSMISEVLLLFDLKSSKTIVWWSVIHAG